MSEQEGRDKLLKGIQGSWPLYWEETEDGFAAESRGVEFRLYLHDSPNTLAMIVGDDTIKTWTFDGQHIAPKAVKEARSFMSTLSDKIHFVEVHAVNLARLKRAWPIFWRSVEGDSFSLPPGPNRGDGHFYRGYIEENEDILVWAKHYWASDSWQVWFEHKMYWGLMMPDDPPKEYHLSDAIRLSKLRLERFLSITADVAEAILV